MKCVASMRDQNLTYRLTFKHSPCLICIWMNVPHKAKDEVHPFWSHQQPCNLILLEYLATSLIRNGSSALKHGPNKFNRAEVGAVPEPKMLDWFIPFKTTVFTWFWDMCFVETFSCVQLFDSLILNVIIYIAQGATELPLKLKVPHTGRFRNTMKPLKNHICRATSSETDTFKGKWN